MPDAKQSENKRDAGRERAVDAVAWFSILANAVEAGNFAEAARAQAELDRLGVAVKYRASARHEREGRP